MDKPKGMHGIYLIKGRPDQVPLYPATDDYLVFINGLYKGHFDTLTEAKVKFKEELALSKETV